MKRLSRATDRAELVVRLRHLEPASAGRWGRMSVGQMICHLADAFRFGMDEKLVAPQGPSWLNRTAVKWLVLHTPLGWPRGIAGGPELAQGVGGRGTPPSDLRTDLETMMALMERFAASGPDRRPHHPRFGPLTESEWMRWGWAHVDHHLRQFGQ